MGSFDKAAHILAYGVFAALAHRMNLSGRRFVLVCIGIVAYGGLLEVAQSFVPGRYMSVPDVLANTLGVLLAALLRTKFPAKRKAHGNV